MAKLFRKNRQRYISFILAVVMFAALLPSFTLSLQAGLTTIYVNSLTGNDISGNGENGMLIYAAGAGKIEGNRISGNNLAGIEVWDAQPSSILNNSIENNKKDAILIRGKAARVRLGQNKFSGNRGEEVKNSGGQIIPF